MGWAKNYIEQLKTTDEIQFRPRGNSMSRLIKSGQLVTVAAVRHVAELNVGDVVLCTVRGNDYLHLIVAIKDKKYQIGNTHGRINGWTSADKIYGKVTEIGNV